MEEKGKRMNQLENKVNSLHSKLNKINEDLTYIKEHITELNLKVPRRTKGWFSSGWDDAGQEEEIRNYKLKK